MLVAAVMANADHANGAQGMNLVDLLDSMDITETLDDGPAQKSAIRFEAATPIPLKYLGPDLLERRKRETDRILDLLEQEEEAYFRKEEEKEEWGDVIPARLKARRQPPTEEQQHPMKLQIIEHPPARSSIFAPRSRPQQPTFPIIATGEDSDDEPLFMPSAPSSEEEEEESDLEDEDFDLGADMDDAMQQREIALEYYKRRETLGLGPQGGALGGSVAARDTNEWDQEVCCFVLVNDTIHLIIS